MHIITASTSTAASSKAILSQPISTWPTSSGRKGVFLTRFRMAPPAVPTSASGTSRRGRSVFKGELRGQLRRRGEAIQHAAPAGPADQHIGMRLGPLLAVEWIFHIGTALVS